MKEKPKKILGFIFLPIYLPLAIIIVVCITTSMWLINDFSWLETLNPEQFEFYKKWRNKE